VLLLDQANLREHDRVIAVGDLVTKGPKSREVLELFRTDNRFFSVLGNHDLALLRHRRGEGNSLKNSQAQTASDLDADSEVYCQLLGSLPLMIDLGDHVVVHAGIRPGIPFEEQTPEDLTELRTLGKDRTNRKGDRWYDFYDGEKTVLFGHWPSPEPIIATRAIGLDTGCVYGNRLTSYIVETREFVTQPALRVYDRPNKKLAKAGSN